MKILIFASDGTQRFCSCFKTCKEIYTERSGEQQLRARGSPQTCPYRSVVNWSFIKMKLLASLFKCSKGKASVCGSVGVLWYNTPSMVCTAICGNDYRDRWGIFYI